MNSREIELVLKARLEASDASNDAANLGTQLGSAIEKAFDGLGEKLASKFAEEFKNKLSQSNLIPSMSGGQGAISGAPMQPPQIGGTYGSYDIQAQIKARTNDDGRWLYSASDNVDKVTNAIASGGGSAGRSNAPGSYYNTPQFAPKTYGAATILQNFQDEYGNRGNGSANVSRSEANALDDTVRRYRLFQQVSKVNPEFQLSNVGLNQEQVTQARERLTGLASSAASTLANKDLDKKIELLTAALDKMGEKYEKASNKEEKTQADKDLIETYQRREGELHKTVKERADMQGAVQSAAKAAQELPAEPMPESGFSRAGRFARGAGAAMVVAGEVGQMLSSWNYMGRRNDAYATDLDNYGVRQRLRGDNTGIVANALEGGTDEQKSRARSRAWGNFFSELTSGVGQLAVGAGGIAASGVAEVSSLGAATPLALAGAAVSGGVALNGVRTIGSSINAYRTMDERIAANLQQEQQAAMLKNEEFTRSFNYQRANRISGYNDAQAMGSDQLSSFLMGYDPNRPGDNVMNRNNGSGLSRDQLLGQQRRFARMGGVYNGVDSLTSDMAAQTGMTDLNFLTGQGFANAADTAVATFRGGGFTRAEAIARTRDEYNGLRSAGLEETGLVDAFNARNGFAQQGLDFGGAASFGMRSAAGYAAANNMTEGFQVGKLQNMQYNFQSSVNTGAGLKGIAKSQAINDLEKKLGPDVKFSEADRIAFQLGQIGPDALRKYAKNMSSDQLSQLSDDTMKDIENRTVDLYTGSLGGNREVAQTMLNYESGGRSSLELQQRMFGGDAQAVMPKEGDVRSGRTAPQGKAEKQQDIDVEVSEFNTGIATLKAGFEALQKETDNLVKKFQQIKIQAYNNQVAKAPAPQQFQAGPGGRFSE